MAIDSASKRASVLGFGFVALTLIIPDGTLDQGDRQTINDSYSGILAVEPAVFPSQTEGLSSIIQDRGKGVLSSISSDGKGVLSQIDESLGLSSIIQSRGKGVSSPITETGQGVES